MSYTIVDATIEVILDTLVNVPIINKILEKICIKCLETEWE